MWPSGPWELNSFLLRVIQRVGFDREHDRPAIALLYVDIVLNRRRRRLRQRDMFTCSR